MNGYWSRIGVGGSSSFHENELKMPTLYYFPYDGNSLMELCHENNWLWNWKISEKQKTVLIQRNETHTYGLMRLSDSLKKKEVVWTSKK